MTDQQAESGPQQETPAEEKIGTVRIAPEVLATIAALAAQAVPGVVRLEGGFAADVGRLIRRRQTLTGVKVAVENDEVLVELHLVLKPDVSMYQVATEVQKQVAQAIVQMVGMPVHSVDVYIEDVE